MVAPPGRRRRSGAPSLSPGLLHIYFEAIGLGSSFETYVMICNLPLRTASTGAAIRLRRFAGRFAQRADIQRFWLAAGLERQVGDQQRRRQSQKADEESREHHAQNGRGHRSANLRLDDSDRALPRRALMRAHRHLLDLRQRQAANLRRRISSGRALHGSGQIVGQDRAENRHADG